jgi:hypothetical protein
MSADESVEFKRRRYDRWADDEPTGVDIKEDGSELDKQEAEPECVCKAVAAYAKDRVTNSIRLMGVGVVDEEGAM